MPLWEDQRANLKLVDGIRLLTLIGLSNHHGDQKQNPEHVENIRLILERNTRNHYLVGQVQDIAVLVPIGGQVFVRYHGLIVDELCDESIHEHRHLLNTDMTLNVTCRLTIFNQNTPHERAHVSLGDSEFNF